MSIGTAVMLAVSLAAGGAPGTAAPCLLDSKDRPVNCPVAAHPPQGPGPKSTPLARETCVNPVTHRRMKRPPAMLAP
jgi:hypothetical protein